MWGRGGRRIERERCKEMEGEIRKEGEEDRKKQRIGRKEGEGMRRNGER